MTAVAVGVREHDAKRQLMKVDKAFKAARGPDAGGPVPHHLRMPELLLRHVQKPLPPPTVVIVIGAERYMHVHRRARIAALTAASARMEHHPVAAHRPRPLPSAPRLGAIGQKPAWRMKSRMSGTRALHDPPTLDLMEFAVAEVRWAGRSPGSSASRAGTCRPDDPRRDILPPFLGPADEDDVAPLEIGKGFDQRNPDAPRSRRHPSPRSWDANRANALQAHRAQRAFPKGPPVSLPQACSTR